MRKKILIGVIGITGLLLAAGVSPAMADTVSSTVSGGSLSVTTAGATLTGVTLNGTSAQTATGTSTSAWTITDSRGTGAAWAVSVTATVPTSAAGTVDTTARTIEVSQLSITPGAISAATGADPITGISAPVLAMSTSSQSLITSTGTNKGSYTLTPQYSLTVPVNAYRSNWSGAIGTSTQNPYTSTLTYTIG
jgi:hypothetical protein